MHFSLVNSNIHSTTLSELQFSNLLSHVMAAVTFLLDGERVSLSSLYGRQLPWPVLFISLPAMLFLVLIFYTSPFLPQSIVCLYKEARGQMDILQYLVGVGYISWLIEAEG